MEADQIIEILANYIWHLRVPNAVCISHLLLIDRRTSVDLWRHKFALSDTFNLEKLIIFVNSLKRIRAGTFLKLTSETTICDNWTAKVSVKCIKCNLTPKSFLPKKETKFQMREQIIRNPARSSQIWEMVYDKLAKSATYSIRISILPYVVAIWGVTLWYWPTLIVSLGTFSTVEFGYSSKKL